jgi:hypothetical protein
MSASALLAGLVAASKLGDECLVRDVLDAMGANAAPSLAPALTAAAASGRTRVVALLLSRGAASAGEREDGDDGDTAAAAAAAAPACEPALHAALARGRVRCAWLLLAAGHGEPADAAGCTALHVAASCMAGPPSTRAALLRSVLAGGADPDAVNFAGARAVDLLPRDAAEARALLGLAAAATRCAATGALFGPLELRHICHSSGAFVSEEASAEVRGERLRASAARGRRDARTPAPLRLSHPPNEHAARARR